MIISENNRTVIAQVLIKIEMYKIRFAMIKPINIAQKL